MHFCCNFLSLESSFCKPFFAFIRLTWAPASRRAITTSVCPPLLCTTVLKPQYQRGTLDESCVLCERVDLQAQISGVVPYLSPASTFAPCLIKQVVRPHINHNQEATSGEAGPDQGSPCRPPTAGRCSGESLAGSPGHSTCSPHPIPHHFIRSKTTTITTSQARSNKTGLTSAPAATKSSATARLSVEQQSNWS